MTEPPVHPDRADHPNEDLDGRPRRLRRAAVAAWIVGAVVVVTMIVLHLTGVAPN